VNDGWDFPLPHADFGNLRVSDHSAIGHGDCEKDRRTSRGRLEKGEGATEFSPPPPDGAVVAYPKIAEARQREGKSQSSFTNFGWSYYILYQEWWHTQKRVISKREDHSQIDDAFYSLKWSSKYHSCF